MQSAVEHKRFLNVKAGLARDIFGMRVVAFCALCNHANKGKVIGTSFERFGQVFL